jgi:hypothetical protein
MNSKLSFYDEEFYLVSFDIEADGAFSNPKWMPLDNHKGQKEFS